MFSSRNQRPRSASRQPVWRSAYSIALAGYSWVLCVSACGRERLVAVGDEDASSSGGSSSGGSSCGMINETCNSTGDCCSNVCAGNGTGQVCSTPPACLAGGVACETPSDCCSKVCGSDHLCPLLSGCTIVGEPCVTSTDCCSGACSDPGTGSPSCQALGGCLPTGEVCFSKSDCCSQLCASNDDTGVYRCQAAPNCAPMGEICSRSPQNTACCAAGPGPGPGHDTGFCERTSTGVSRCSMPLLGFKCLEDSSDCVVSEDCCSKYCLPNDSGHFTCMPSCAALDDRCSASRDCCQSSSGTACNEGTCQKTGIQCRQLGVNCDKGTDCCSGRCGSETTTTTTCLVPMGY